MLSPLPPPPEDRTSLLLWCPQKHHVPVVVFSISCDQQISFKSEFLTLDCYLLLLLLVVVVVVVVVLLLLSLSLSLFYYFIFFNRHPNLNAIQYIFVNMAISKELIRMLLTAFSNTNY